MSILLYDLLTFMHEVNQRINFDEFCVQAE